MLAAIKGSTMAGDSRTQPSADSVSVIEWAMVKLVTMPSQ